MCYTRTAWGSKPSPAWPPATGPLPPSQPPVHLYLRKPGQHGKGNPQESLASELLEEVCIPLKQKEENGMWSAETHPGVSPQHSPAWCGDRHQVGTQVFGAH